MNEIRLALCHEDDNLLVVDKPINVAAIPERDHGQPSIWRQLEAQRAERLWVVHRLDKEVSGLLVFARNAATHRRLSMAFEQREVGKTYVALVHGQPQSGEGIIDAPIAQFGSGRMGVRDAGGKPSRTAFRVLQRRPDCALLELDPLTGRRHQLRVHCYHLGHPIVGDTRYGSADHQSGHPRLMLHAWKLRLPMGEGRMLMLESPPPEPLRLAPHSLA